MTTYDLIEKGLNDANIVVHQSNISEYTNYCELDGKWYKRTIKKLKNKPAELD